MCEMCEGQTIDQVLDRVAGLVRTHGWALQSVGGGGRVGWVYTVGLRTSYGHPELLVIDTDIGRAARQLNRLGAAVRDGAVLGVGAALDPDGSPIELVEVHTVHARGDLMAVWHRLHGRLPDDERPALEVLQVLDPRVVDDGPRPVRERLDRPFARTP